MDRRTVRGFAWFVFPNPADPEDHTEPGRPFGEGGELPPGVVDFWPVSAELGLESGRTGVELLVVTEAPEPPPLPSSYSASPARLPDGFEAGGGLVRLARVVGARETARGAVQECAFEADEELPIEVTGPTPGHLVGPRQAGAASAEAGVNEPGTGARIGGRSSAATVTGGSIGMGAGEAEHPGAPVGGPAVTSSGADEGRDVGPGATAARNAARAGAGHSDDPARSLASPDELAAGAGQTGE